MVCTSLAIKEVVGLLLMALFALCFIDFVEGCSEAVNVKQCLYGTVPFDQT